METGSYLCQIPAPFANPDFQIHMASAHFTETLLRKRDSIFFIQSDYF